MYRSDSYEILDKRVTARDSSVNNVENLTPEICEVLQNYVILIDTIYYKEIKVNGIF